MSFLHHSSRGRQAVDEQPADDERIDGEHPATGAPGEEPVTPPNGQAAERPRYAFGYAPDDAGEDDGPGGSVVRGDVVHEDDVLGDSEVRGGVLHDADGDYPPVTVPDIPVSAEAAPTAAMPAAAAPAGEPPAVNGNWPAEPTFTPVPAPRPVTERKQATQATAAQPEAIDAADLSEPLLGDAAGLRARWQRAQSDFVDDPRAAVSDAAALVEQTARAMIDAVEQRQRLLRQQWERGQAGDGSAQAGEPADTEWLRLTMRRYRDLFNQLCGR